MFVKLGWCKSFSSDVTRRFESGELVDRDSLVVLVFLLLVILFGDDVACGVLKLISLSVWSVLDSWMRDS